jgi:hypothetical protein
MRTQQLNVKLTRNEREQNWSVEINGKSYDFISIESVKALVNRAVSSVEESMTDSMRPPQ